MEHKNKKIEIFRLEDRVLFEAATASAIVEASESAQDASNASDNKNSSESVSSNENSHSISKVHGDSLNVTPETYNNDTENQEDATSVNSYNGNVIDSWSDDNVQSAIETFSQNAEILDIMIHDALA